MNDIVSKKEAKEYNKEMAKVADELFADVLVQKQKRRRTKRAVDVACACPQPQLRWKESSGWYCGVCYKSPRN